MTPTVFLVILCLGVASAAIVPDAWLVAELQEQKDKEGLKKAMWNEFIMKVHSSKNDQEKDGIDIETRTFFGQLSGEELMKIMTNIFHPMLEEEKPRPVGDVPEFEDYAESGDGFLVPNQLQ
ncbi:trophoblast-specific protein alpha-like [Mus pahari]|uniref:trophoblast-specific protein alpha-like n=1 Tax=Mus pahari TaxID=10093 RepID=UPI000A30E756|nr:trophoblast-specific protein alpha-like [Mus pahari]